MKLKPSVEDYQNLRDAVNIAVKSGMTKNEVVGVVGDQLFAIHHFGGGDVDKAMAEIVKIEAEIVELNRKIAEHPNNK